MGILTKIIKERPKFDIPFTVVKIVSIREEIETVIRIIDDSYSIKGTVVKTIELASFEGELAPLYLHYLNHYLKLAKEINTTLRSSRV